MINAASAAAKKETLTRMFYSKDGDQAILEQTFYKAR